MKPMLAETWIASKVKFPVIAQPKIDGVRALNMLGELTGRSLKPFKNRYLTTQHSHSALIGFDGELAAESETHPAFCRLTSSATGSYEGEPYILWWLFDYITVDNKNAGYEHRLAQLTERVRHVQGEAPLLFNHLRVMPSKVCYNMVELEAF